MSHQDVKSVQVEEPALLIRINQNYRPGMDSKDLYDQTRGVWVIGKRRETANYALAIYHGVVVEVYAIKEWHHAGTTYPPGVIDPARFGNRWEFTGEVAPEEIRGKYVGNSVSAYFEKGAANPVMYVNC